MSRGMVEFVLKIWWAILLHTLPRSTTFLSSTAGNLLDMLVNENRLSALLFISAIRIVAPPRIGASQTSHHCPYCVCSVQCSQLNKMRPALGRDSLGSLYHCPFFLLQIPLVPPTSCTGRRTVKHSPIPSATIDLSRRVSAPIGASTSLISLGV